MSSASDFVIENGVLQEYKGHEKEIEIPENVTTIGAAVFKGRKSLESVKIPTSVTRIRESAFSGCSGLTRIEIPESVTRIDDRAFALCKGLTELTIPKNVNIMGKKVFSGCQNLTKVTILCRTVGKDAFYNCGDIEVYVPNGLQYAEPAFSGCNCSLHIWRWVPEFTKLVKDGNVEIYVNEFLSLPPAHRQQTALRMITDDTLEFDSDCGKACLVFMKENAEKMCSIIIRNPKALHFMCEHELIQAKSLDTYFQEAEIINDPELKALLLDYQNRLGDNVVSKARAQKEKRQRTYENAMIERLSARDPSKGIEGMVFVITGMLESWEREEAKEWLERHGAELGSSVTMRTDYLVTNDSNSGSNKNRKAKEYGITIIDENEFNHLIGRDIE